MVASDIETSSLEKRNLNSLRIDLTEKLPFEDGSFDVVYAHLSLHYFDLETTHMIFQEIERVLKPGGVFAFLTNSTDDPEYATGIRLERDFYVIGKVTKRYFSVESVKELTGGFQAELVDNLGQTYKDQMKGVTHLIRFIGRKR